MKKIMVDCSVCKTSNSMTAKKVPKSSLFVRFIGYLIMIPSIVCLLISLSTFFSGCSTTSEMMEVAQSDAELAGIAIATTAGFGFSVFIGMSSLVSGFIGWVLLMKKKVFKCNICGYIMDRC